MQGKIIEVIHIAKTYRTTARRNRCSADNRHTLHTRSYGGFEKIKAAVPYALNKGVTPIRWHGGFRREPPWSTLTADKFRRYLHYRQKNPGHRTGPVWQPVRKLSQCNWIPCFLRSNSFLLSGRFFIPVGPEHRVNIVRTLSTVSFPAAPFRFSRKRWMEEKWMEQPCGETNRFF